LAVFLASPASGKLTGKLIAAPYDPWREWAGKAEELNATPLYTIRRLDPFTIKPLLKGLGYWLFVGWEGSEKKVSGFRRIKLARPIDNKPQKSYE
jgi:hypothetical protein